MRILHHWRLFLLVGLLGLAGCRSGLQENTTSITPPAATEPVAEAEDSAEPIPPPSTTAPQVEEDATAPPEEGEVTADAPGAFGEMTTFEDPNGLFTIDYPENFEVRDSGGILGDYSYTFLTPGNRGALIVSLALSESGSPTDETWAATTRQANLNRALLAPVRLDSFTEVGREIGTDERTIRIELASEMDEMKGVMWLAEDQGTVALLVWAVPDDMWAESHLVLDSAIESFTWSPERVQEVIPGLE